MNSWIPVTVRLPEPNVPVLATWSDGENLNIDILVYDGGWIKETDIYYSSVFGDVTAWMPLPDPYKGE